MSEEEIIKQCKDIIFAINLQGHLNDEERNSIQYLQGLIDLYQQEKQKNIDLTQELETRKWIKIKENGEVQPAFYISKDKIKEKIKELDKVQKANTKMFSHGVDILSNQIMDTYSNKIMINMSIREFLQQLLEEEQK